MKRFAYVLNIRMAKNKRKGDKENVKRNQEGMW